MPYVLPPSTSVPLRRAHAQDTAKSAEFFLARGFSYVHTTLSCSQSCGIFVSPHDVSLVLSCCSVLCSCVSRLRPQLSALSRFMASKSKKTLLSGESLHAAEVRTKAALDQRDEKSIARVSVQWNERAESALSWEQRVCWMCSVGCLGMP